VYYWSFSGWEVRGCGVEVEADGKEMLVPMSYRSGARPDPCVAGGSRSYV